MQTVAAMDSIGQTLQQLASWIWQNIGTITTVPALAGAVLFGWHRYWRLRIEHMGVDYSLASFYKRVDEDGDSGDAVLPDENVYVTQQGDHYHTASCFISGDPRTLADALRAGLQPCSHCLGNQ